MPMLRKEEEEVRLALSKEALNTYKKPCSSAQAFTLVPISKQMSKLSTAQGPEKSTGLPDPNSIPSLIFIVLVVLFMLLF
jgi:hypothetical protein